MATSNTKSTCRSRLPDLSHLPPATTPREAFRTRLTGQRTPIIISSDNENDDSGDEDDVNWVGNSDVISSHQPKLGPGVAKKFSIRPRSRTSSDRSPTTTSDTKRQKLRDSPSPTRNRRDQVVVVDEYDEHPYHDEKQDREGNIYNPFIIDDEEEEDAMSLAEDTNSEFPTSDINRNPARTRRDPDSIPPYYDDPKLRIRMYRGFGFGKFPVPLELSQEHERICRDWDDRRGIGFNEHLLVDPEDDDFEVDAFWDVPVSPLEQVCIQQIHDILPDIDPDFLRSKVHQHYEVIRFADEEIEVHPDLDTIVAEIMEQGSYPKNTSSEREKQMLFLEETGKTIEWNKNHTTNHHYIVDTVKLLAEHFNHVPVDFVHMLMMEKRSLWDTFLHINHAERDYFQSSTKPYNRLSLPREGIVVGFDRGPYLLSDRQYYANLINEYQATRQQAAREALHEARERRLVKDESDNLERHRAEKSLIECQCCFDDEVPLNRLVVCTGPTTHSFCYSCVRSLANNQVGLMKHQMLCMDGSGCIATLASGSIAKAIPLKVLDRLAFNQQHAEIAAAKIEGLEQCPMCDFKAIVDPIEIDSVFSCQNPECLKMTCRKCHQPAHLPRTCEEFKKDQGLQVRHKIEEARSQAMIRTCPSCNAKIVKESGCNKMRCTCGIILCYVCKVDLSNDTNPYAHFDGNGHVTTGRKCPLHDRPGTDRHAQDANEAENKAIEEVKALDPTVEESTLRIETHKKSEELSAMEARRRRNQGNSVSRAHRRARRRQVEADIPAPPVHAPAILGNELPPMPFLANNEFDGRLGMFGPFAGGPDMPYGNRRENLPALFHPPPRPIPLWDDADRFQRLNEAQEQDNNIRSIATAARIQGFRNELADRRRLQGLRNEHLPNMIPASNTPWRRRLMPKMNDMLQRMGADNGDNTGGQRQTVERPVAHFGVPNQIEGFRVRQELPALGSIHRQATQPTIPHPPANHRPNFPSYQFVSNEHPHQQQNAFMALRFDFEDRRDARRANSPTGDGGVPWRMLE